MRFNVLVLTLLVGCASSTTRAPSHDAATDAALDAASVDAVVDAAPADAAPVDAAPAVPLDAAVPASDVNPTRIYAVEECPQRLLPAELAVTQSAGPSACQRSSDCTLRPNGICQGYERANGVIEYPYCRYEDCSSLTPCPAELRCECSFEGLRRCLSIGCTGDDSCPAGQRCERTMTGCNYQQLGDYLCTRADDQCLTHDDCTDAGLGNWCTVENGRRICISHTCD